MGFRLKDTQGNTGLWGGHPVALAVKGRWWDGEEPWYLSAMLWAPLWGQTKGLHGLNAAPPHTAGLTTLVESCTGDGTARFYNNRLSWSSGWDASTPGFAAVATARHPCWHHDQAPQGCLTRVPAWNPNEQNTNDSLLRPLSLLSCLLNLAPQVGATATSCIHCVAHSGV